MHAAPRGIAAAALDGGLTDVRSRKPGQGRGYSLADPAPGKGAFMSAESTPERSKAQRTAGGNVVFALGVTVFLAAVLIGAFAAVALLLDAADAAPLSSVIPGDGRNALVVGGIALGGVTGLVVPVVLFGMVKGTDKNPRVGVGAAGRKLLALLAFDVYVLVLAVVVAQLGRLLPAPATTLAAVFAVGFSWMPAAMIPPERLGLPARRSK